MPNWVSNWVGVSGTEADITAFVEKAKKPYTSKHKGKGYNDPVTKEWKYDADVEYEQVNEDKLMFWNFIEPEDKEAYFADAHGKKPEGYEGWSTEDKMAHDLKFTGNGWYDWNVREWGTKWDASSVDGGEIIADGKGNASTSYSFETAWSIPEPVFVAMVAQHPELSFDFECEEEQGWGAKFTSSEGEEHTLILTEEWDIPDCHADYVNRDREDSCVCSYSDDVDDYYDDCPNKVREFAVVVTRTYTVTAKSAEEAWGKIDTEIVNAPTPIADGITLEDEDTAFVKDGETGERLYPLSEELA